MVFEDIHFMGRPYDPILAYEQSKTANVLFAVGASARWAGEGITSNALVPSAIATRLQRLTGDMKTPLERCKTPEQGAATSILLATSRLLAGVGGRYFLGLQRVAPVRRKIPLLKGLPPMPWIRATPITSGRSPCASYFDSVVPSAQLRIFWLIFVLILQNS
jgi:hypothetical protein